MKRLTLLRHAKSSWPDPPLDDFDRPLNARGRGAATLMGAYMAEQGLTPDFILCSSAIRTRQTLALILPNFNNAEAHYTDNLYLASPAAMRAQIKTAPDSYNHVLVIAHNPGIQMLALDLADRSSADKGALQKIEHKYPTAGLAYFECAVVRWSDIVKGALRLFMTPKMLLQNMD